MDGRQRLVLVDEDANVRNHVAASLAEQGYNCVGVSDLARAAALTERMDVSGVLVNVGRLDPQLIDEMARFRRQHPQLPLLAFDPPELEEGHHTGVVRRHLRLVSASDVAFGQAAPEFTTTLH